MKKICFILILFSNLIFSQSWLNVANFIGDGRHHPITFSNDNYGFVVSGSYLNDVFKYIRKTSKKFDLVFADPPYDFSEQDYLLLIKEIQKNILRTQESILVLEHFKKKTFGEIQGFMFIKNYGDCSFSFINQKSGQKPAFK